MDIKDLEEHLRLGKEDALAELFSIHQDRLWRIVTFRMHPELRRRLDPEDILQESYLAAVKRLRFFGQGDFNSSFLWLRLIVNQTLSDVHRRHLGAQARDIFKEAAIDSARYYQDTSISMAIRLVETATSPSQVASRQELFDKVKKVIADMEPFDRDILALRHFEELTNSEAANVLGIEQKAASIRYVRALRRLKDKLSRLPGFFEDQNNA